MNITCYDIDGNLLKTLTQWDINQKIVINNLSLTNTPEVHFCNPHSELALVGESTYSDGTLTTEVPNILLQENLPIIVYIYVPKGDGSAKTTYSIRIPVNPRPKPADYEYSDNAHFITYEELQAALANSVEVIELANAAADRANEAASVAETSMEYGKNNFANAVKGTAHADCGEYIYIDDISPIEHEMEVLLTQKNLLRLGTEYYSPGRSQTINGVTFTVNEDGSITANGTATGGASFAIKPHVDGVYKTGSKTVALSGCPAGGSATTYCMRLKNQASAYGNSDEYGDGKIINDVDIDGSYIGCIVFGGTTVENLVFYPQLEYGNEVTEYEPSVDLSTVNVTACGNNIANIPDISSDSYGFSMKNYTQWYLDLPVGTEITISADCNTAEANSASFAWQLGLNNSLPTITLWMGSKTNSTTKRISYTHIKTLDISKSDVRASTLYLGQGFTTDRTFKNVTVNIGNTDLGYEKYRGFSATSDVNGIVSNLHSTSPDMYVFTSNNLVNIDCQYNRDTKLAVQGDMNDNNPDSPNYIKNRTHWKEDIERDYTVLPNIEPDPITEFVEHGKKIGLEIGKEYTLEAHLKDGTLQTIQAIATEYPVDEVGIAGIPCIIVENTCNIIDGVVFDATAEPPITAGDNCYYQYLGSVVDFVEKGIIKNLPNVETIIHKIPNEYLPNQKPENGSITSSMIANSAITTNHLGYRAVTTEKIQNSAITSEKIQPGAVSVSKTYDIKNLFSSEIPYGDAIKDIMISSVLNGQKCACIDANLLFTAENPTINLSYSKYYSGSGFVYYPLYSVQLSKPAHTSVPIWIRFTWENEKAIWEISVDGNSTFVIGKYFPTSWYLKTSDEITFYGNVKLDQLKAP